MQYNNCIPHNNNKSYDEYAYQLPTQLSSSSVIDYLVIGHGCHVCLPIAYLKICMFFFTAWEFYKKSDSSSSRKLFRFSLVHLPALMLLMLVNKKYWSSSDTQEQESSTDLKLADSLITVLPRPRGPVVAAQETNTAS